MHQDEKRIDALITIWKEINSYINSIEISYAKIVSILITIMGAIIVYFKGDIVPKTFFDCNFYLIVFMPVAIASVIAYLSYQFRWVAISRMYLTSIEKEINALLEKNYYTWNYDIVEKYVAHRNIANTKVLPLINMIFFILSLVYFDGSVIVSELNVAFKISYCVFTVVLVVVCVIPFFGNETIRKEVYSFPEE